MKEFIKQIFCNHDYKYVGGMYCKCNKCKKIKICDICNKRITEKEFKNNDGYCHKCFTKKQGK